jgi:coenzyme F420-reducing hydrogenase gamma subunit
MTATKPKLAVHKFSSCDGCQLALLNLGEPLLLLPELVDIVHFAEAGPCDTVAKADIALVEGSVSTPEDIKRIEQVRENSGLLIAIGACATAGGLQALANFDDRAAWMASVYDQPEHIEALQTSHPISHYIKVDFEIPGCPVNSRQVVGALRDLLTGVKPRQESRSVCMECKRQGLVCTMVSKGEPCMGAVTVAGCGALCPAMGRGCYSCYGPLKLINDDAMVEGLLKLGLDQAAIARRFHFIANHAPAFKQVGERLKEGSNE